MTQTLAPPTTQPTGTMIPGGLHTQFVTIRNEGDVDFNMKYGPRDRLIIPVGQQVTVVEEVAWQFVGRWWMDNNNKNRDRVREYDRLRTLYGAYEDEMLWEQNQPHLGVYDGQGERILTVVDDPEGNRGPVRATEFSKQMSLEGQMAAMLQRQEELERNIARLVAQRDAAAQPMPPTETAPATAPVSTVDLGAAGPVPVAAPMVQVPTAPTEVATAPGPVIPMPQSTDGAIVDPDPHDPGEIYGTRLDVTPEPIPGQPATVPVDEPQRTRIKGH